MSEDKYTYKAIGTYTEEDGLSFQMSLHPTPKFNLWQRLKAIFIRPKLSKEALEPAEKIQIIPSGRIDYCCECKKDHGYDCPLDEQI